MKAFRKFWERRKDLGDPNYLWIRSKPGFLSRAIVRVLKQAVPLADPTAPADEIHVDTHNLGKLPTVWLSFNLSVQTCRYFVIERAPALCLIRWLCIFEIYQVILCMSALRWVR